MHETSTPNGRTENLVDELIAEWSDMLREKVEPGREGLRILDLPPGRTLRFCVVGVTKSGKTSLMNAIFGRPVGYEAASAGTTDKIMRAVLPSGVEIYDTPGAGDPPHVIGGRQIDFENITRQFLGVPQLAFDPADDEVYLCTRKEEDGLCTEIVRRQEEFQGHTVDVVDYPTIPRCEELGCPHRSAHEPSAAVAAFRPDVVLEVLSSTIGRDVLSFHRALAKELDAPLVVAQRVDAHMTPQQRREIADGAAKWGIDAIQVDCKTDPDSVSRVVEALVDEAPVWAKSAFNDSLDRAHRLSRLQLFMKQVTDVAVVMVDDVRDLDALFAEMPRIIRQLMFVWARHQCGRDGRDLAELARLPDFRKYAARIVEKAPDVNEWELRARAIASVMHSRGVLQRLRDVFSFDLGRYHDEIDAEIVQLRGGRSTKRTRTVETPSVEERAAGFALFYEALVGCLVEIEGLPRGVMDDVRRVLGGEGRYRSLSEVFGDLLRQQGLSSRSSSTAELGDRATAVARVLRDAAETAGQGRGAR